MSIEKLCELFGKTRHAFYDHQWRQHDDFLKDELIIQMVLDIREDLPGVGARKLQHMLKPKLVEHKLGVGRDYLFGLLCEHNLLIRTRRRKAITTDSRHWMHKYENRIIGLTVDGPGQLWVSDITFIRLINGFIYLCLITDAYSRKIIGYHLGKNLLAEGCLSALEMALANRVNKSSALIHHSDRGSQYCCKEYVGLLYNNNIKISMTQKGDPYENALAERVNGIIKSEFNLFSSQFGFEETGIRVEKAIRAYNGLRPHSSCDYFTPTEAHNMTGVLKKRWKNYNQSSFINPLILETKFRNFETNQPV